MALSPLPPLFSSEFIKDPYPAYKHLRETEPVYKVMLPSGFPAWLVTGYREAAEVLKDNRFMKDFSKLYGEHFSIYTNNMLFSDPPDHRRLRGLVQQAFTSIMIEGMRERVESIAAGLLDAAEKKGSMELINDYAFQLPIIVICEILGIPDQDRDRFRLWSNSIIGSLEPESSSQVGLHMAQFKEYLSNWFSHVRNNPGDDLISHLLLAEENGEMLTEEEIYGVVSLLIIAGHETTVNLIGNGAAALFDHPEQLALLKEKHELMNGAIEELLRYNGPVEFSTDRFAGEDINFHGAAIKRGDFVIVALNSANRDSYLTDNPDVLDITRSKSRHLAFGSGIHHCLGAPLARMEGQIALGMLFERFPHAKPAISLQDLEWRPGMIVRGIKELPLLLK